MSAAVQKPLSDRDTRREAILDVADKLFLEEGFDATSMSMIAARLGGSKGTLYNYFKNKEDLFAASVERHCVWQGEAMSALLQEGRDLRETLTQLGVRHLAMILSEDNLRRFRVVTAEAERAPEIGRIFYETGPLSGATRLSAYLAAAMKQGELKREDPMQAAYHFLGLCGTRMHKARLCNYGAPPTQGEMESEVDSAVRLFLAAYSADKKR